MRFPHWLKSVASAFVLSATAGSAMAQGPGMPGAGFQPAYGTNDPGVLYPQGVPQGYQPYPAVSPYGMGNVAWDQTFRGDDGLWFRRVLNSDREYFGSFDLNVSRIANQGNAHLGSAYIPLDQTSNGLQGVFINTFGQGGLPGTGTGGGATTGAAIPTSRVIIDNRVIPYPILVPSTNVPIGLVNNALFPIRDLTAFHDFHNTGIEGRWGFFNEDGSGMAISGFWAAPDTQSFTMGQDNINGIPITQQIITTLDGSLLFTRNGAIPLDWGFRSNGDIGAITANLGTSKYDLLFHYDVKTSAIGSDTNFFMPPVVQREAFKLRPLIGGRYLNINDRFNFRGIDSGFGYSLTDSVITGGGGGGGQNTASATYRPDALTLQANYDLYEATLSNNVRTNLAGPQAGFRYDFGDGDEFKVWGQSVVGVMANREDYHLYGNNIGDQQGLLLFGGGLDMLATDATFDSSRTIHRISPLFEQTIMAEMKILEMVPIIKRLPGIENTVFRLGYTATVVGGVARAGNSIEWRGFPNDSIIDPGRSTWWMNKWTFGIEKRF